MNSWRIDWLTYGPAALADFEWKFYRDGLQGGEGLAACDSDLGGLAIKSTISILPMRITGGYGFAGHS